jgi:hypothetical protein
MPEQPPITDAGFLSHGKPKSRKHRVTYVERQRQALGLRQGGASYQQIADTLGYATRASAWKAVAAALRGVIVESVSELRALEADRLDRLLLAVWPRALNGDLGAVDRVLAIEKRRAALFGLDAPSKQEITGRGGGPVQIEARPAPDFSQLTDAEVEMLAALAERITPDERDH